MERRDAVSQSSVLSVGPWFYLKEPIKWDVMYILSLSWMVLTFENLAKH